MARRGKAAITPRYAPIAAPLRRLAVRERAPEMAPTKKKTAAIPSPSQKTGGIAAATIPKEEACHFHLAYR
jgi:hypothetical protein